MARQKRLLTLDPSTDQLLSQLDNVSAYVSALVQRSWREWQSALEDLCAADWRAPEILAACDSLNCYWAHGATGRSGQAIALELSDAAALNGLCEKWDVPPAVWGKRVESVRESDLLAGALLTVTSEFWAGNSACEAAIRRAA